MERKKHILEVKDLKKHFLIKRGVMLKQVGEVKAVDEVSFKIRKKQTYGLVGESGSGKSTLARTILKLLPADGGRIIFDGNDITEVEGKEFRPYRKRIQAVFQDPMNSIDPRYRIKDVLKESLLTLKRKMNKDKLDQEINRFLKRVNLPINLKYNYPHQISGGQAQRVCIARAMCGNPELVVLDEPTSGLDVTTASKLIKLLMNLQQEFDISYLFITHDLKVVKKVSHTIGVMLEGKIIEEKDTPTLFNNPSHSYTQKLLKASLFE